MSKKVELNEMELEKASGGNIIKDTWARHKRIRESL